MQTLLDDDLVSPGRIIESRAHGSVPPFYGCSTLRIRRSLIRAVWVIDHHVVPSLSGSSRHRHYNPITGLVIFQTVVFGSDLP